MIKLVSYAALLLTVSTVPAIAGWQFTKWGQTPAQVVAASNGSVKLITSPKEQENLGRQGFRALATGHYATPKFDFDADFQFLEGRLVAVGLDLRDYTQCPKLKAALSGKYKDSADGLDADWIDKSAGNLISVSEISIIKSCGVYYRAIDPQSYKPRIRVSPAAMEGL